MLLAYRESGLFIKADPAHRLDHLFILWDHRLLHSRSVEGLLYACAPWLQHYLEICYLLCYPLVPLGFTALYLCVPAAQRGPGRMPKNLPIRELPHARCEGSHASLHSRPRFFSRQFGSGMRMFTDYSPHAITGSGLARNLNCERSCTEAMFDKFWTTVLLATLFCYAIYPLFPLTPPRVLFSDVPGPPVLPLIRNLNLWVLGRLSVQVCLFPSGHAAAALAVRAYRPRLGILFCLAALSVAAATVYGRYHYAADAVAGVCVGVAAFVLSSRIHRSVTRFE
jgi:hypothetical protein